MPWALVRWTTVRKPGVHRVDAAWTYHTSRAAALRAAPADEVWSIVNVAAVPRTPIPDISEIAFRTTPMLDPPYPEARKGTRASW